MLEGSMEPWPLLFLVLLAEIRSMKDSAAVSDVSGRHIPDSRSLVS